MAFVGATGAGKTTIASLLLRFYEPQSGRILLDGCDIREFTQESLRRQIGLVQQDVFLFGDSVRYNIAYAKPDATADEVQAQRRLRRRMSSFKSCLRATIPRWVSAA